jgi:hypothetical protein
MWQCRDGAGSESVSELKARDVHKEPAQLTIEKSETLETKGCVTSNVQRQRAAQAGFDLFVIVLSLFVALQ